MKISVHASQPFVHTPSLPVSATMSLPPSRPQEQVVAPKTDPVPEPTPASSTGESEKQWIIQAALAVSDELHAGGYQNGIRGSEVN
jgi:hypothetical protein